jgi:Histidine kinase
MGAFLFRGLLLTGEGGLLWDPLPGLVIGLAWRGFLPAALAAALSPLLGGIFSGGPQVAALLAEAGLAWLLFRSRPILGTSALTRELLIVPMAGGVTVVGAVVEQVMAMNTPFGPGFATLWIGRALGVMAVAPLVVNLGRDFFARMDRKLFAGWVFLTVLLVVVGRAAATPDLDPRSALALGLIPIVILFWQAMRFGVPGTALGCLLVALLAGLGWVDGHAGLYSFPPGVLALGLAAILGTAHGMAALREEREEIRGWTDAAARAQQLVFWRWRRGEGIEWDRPEAARHIGLQGGRRGWKAEEGWQGPVLWPEPATVAETTLLELRDPAGRVRKLELAGHVESRDTDGRASLVLGTVVEVTAREEARIQRERLMRRETELRALRAQLHPHVIFNALNRIASLAMSDAEAARDLLVRLSRLLRAALLAGEKKETTLAEEMALIRDYLQLEGAGYGERLRFEDQTGGGGELGGLPPLSLFSLVEGAVRRGVGMRKQGATITLSRPEERVLRVQVDPPVPGGEAEFPEWPDPVWKERLAVEQPCRARMVTERDRDGSVKWVELRKEAV